LSIGFPWRHRDAKEERMLVLSRKPLQSIMIGSGVKITVVAVERNQVRIGIEAPREVAIVRSELMDPRREDVGDGGAKPERLPVIASESALPARGATA
jgi:carbon storage regulator